MPVSRSATCICDLMVKERRVGERGLEHQPVQFQKLLQMQSRNMAFYFFSRKKITVDIPNKLSAEESALKDEI